MKDKIFISHCSKDIAYVKLFVEQILRLGLRIPDDRIFCSSMPGRGIESGMNIPNQLKKEMNESALAMLFISHNYKESEICLNEVGAAWMALEENAVKPLLLPGIGFDEIGILKLNHIAIRLDVRKDILQLIDDCKKIITFDYESANLDEKINDYLSEILQLKVTNICDASEEMEDDEYTKCYVKALSPFDKVLRRAIPAYNDGIHRINDISLQNQILKNLSQINGIDKFWYIFADGEYYIGTLKNTMGSWFMSEANWEIEVQDMYVNTTLEYQNEFILIKTAYLNPYQIQSDVGGTSLNVGVLQNGTVISQNEVQNGYAKINGETIDLTGVNIERRERSSGEHWIFLVSEYHKLRYNVEKTNEFCSKLDNGEIAIIEDEILSFLRSLSPEPTVSRYR